nr:MAG TPA: tail tape measure protein [Caudoviricetes sp.]
MNLLDLVVKIGVDDKATSKVAAIGNSIKGGLGTAAKAGVAALGAALASAATGAVALGKAALESYSAYEQNVGGVQKMFGNMGKSLDEYAALTGQTVEQCSDEWQKLEDAQSTVLDNAANAYRTAGMSANQYMEQVTSFSAALITSMGGDTQAAADRANIAMIDMADNVNTFGTSMTDVQNAYQGFAKQNYTMLDNLKLGYGGTQQEMQRLIQDASKMTDIQEKLGVTVDGTSMSFDNVVAAIHVMQESMQIGGTTMREAATTIEGSVNMAKAAWQNWVTELGKDNADMEKLTTQLVDSVTTAASNIVPRIAVIAGAAMTALSEQLPSAVEQIGASLSGYAPTLGASVMSLIGTVAQMAMEYAPTALLAIVDALTMFMTEYAPTLQQAAMTMYLAIAQALTDSGPQIMAALVVMLQSLVQVCIDNAPAMLDAALGLVGMLLQAIVDYGPQILVQLLLLLASLIVAIGMKVGEFFDGGGQLIEGLLMGAQAFFDQVAAWFGSIGDMILGAIGDLGSLLCDAGKSVIDGFLGGLKGAWEGVTGWFGEITASIPQIKGPPVKDAGLLVENGELVMQGFARGMERGWASAEGALGSVAGRVQNSFSPMLGTVKAAPAESGSSSDQVIAWLAANLPSIIEEFTPVMGESEFGRKARKAVAYA